MSGALDLSEPVELIDPVATDLSASLLLGVPGHLWETIAVARVHSAGGVPVLVICSGSLGSVAFARGASSVWIPVGLWQDPVPRKSGL